MYVYNIYVLKLDKKLVKIVYLYMLKNIIRKVFVELNINKKYLYVMI